MGEDIDIGSIITVVIFFTVIIALAIAAVVLGKKKPEVSQELTKEEEFELKAQDLGIHPALYKIGIIKTTSDGGGVKASGEKVSPTRCKKLIDQYDAAMEVKEKQRLAERKKKAEEDAREKEKEERREKARLIYEAEMKELEDYQKNEKIDATVVDIPPIVRKTLITRGGVASKIISFLKDKKEACTDEVYKIGVLQLADDIKVDFKRVCMVMKSLVENERVPGWIDENGDYNEKNEK
ncbi:hypothetical protein ADUPG1_006960 [Aduncisulcus paluster]|uniref:Uncharacterized protein n=1 Tax=Aduncisulcus paluster TaxID=2918883 RepID=A0ABQ5KLV8_9EUKA|nr:hypothetical protein ADUPG1_006960 [Aduncisulcus paluster]